MLVSISAVMASGEVTARDDVLWIDKPAAATMEATRSVVRLPGIH